MLNVAYAECRYAERHGAFKDNTLNDFNYSNFIYNINVSSPPIQLASIFIYFYK